MSEVTMPIKENYATGEELPAANMNLVAKILNSVCPIGKIVDFFGLESQVPNGMLLCNGDTVGNASSNATARANADMEQLFLHLWEVGNADGTLVINDSGGSPTTYGASAAADFAANKAIELPDFRGRTAAGIDDMGGSAAGIATNAEADKAGGVQGAETHTLVIGEMPAHSHNLTRPEVDSPTGSGRKAMEAASGTGTATDSKGGGGAHNNMQPTLFLNKIIWTGADW